MAQAGRPRAVLRHLANLGAYRGPVVERVSATGSDIVSPMFSACCSLLASAPLLAAGAVSAPLWLVPAAAFGDLPAVGRAVALRPAGLSPSRHAGRAGPGGALGAVLAAPRRRQSWGPLPDTDVLPPGHPADHGDPGGDPGSLLTAPIWVPWGRRARRRLEESAAPEAASSPTPASRACCTSRACPACRACDPAVRPRWPGCPAQRERGPSDLATRRLLARREVIAAAPGCCRLPRCPPRPTARCLSHDGSWCAICASPFPATTIADRLPHRPGHRHSHRPRPDPASSPRSRAWPVCRSGLDIPCATGDLR